MLFSRTRKHARGNKAWRCAPGDGPQIFSSLCLVGFVILIPSLEASNDWHGIILVANTINLIQSKKTDGTGRASVQQDGDDCRAASFFSAVNPSRPTLHCCRAASGRSMAPPFAQAPMRKHRTSPLQAPTSPRSPSRSSFVFRWKVVQGQVRPI
ncbi:hypothetical protein U9M48_032985 [Paspalum notatum var. saurae]|uniref:Uncharacterized protein n=1 Tax=Paspalum notatum var. saurae TaxID=547442 RepID=A0AAQ3U924_PASNO